MQEPQTVPEQRHVLFNGPLEVFLDLLPPPVQEREAQHKFATQGSTNPETHTRTHTSEARRTLIRYPKVPLQDSATIVGTPAMSANLHFIAQVTEIPDDKFLAVELPEWNYRFFAGKYQCLLGSFIDVRLGHGRLGGKRIMQFWDENRTISLRRTLTKPTCRVGQYLSTVHALFPMLSLGSRKDT